MSPRPQRRRRLGQAPKHGTSIFTLQDYSKGLIEAIGFQGQRLPGSSGGGLCKRLPGFEGSRSPQTPALCHQRDELDALCSAEVLRLQVAASLVVGYRPGSRVQEVQAAVAQPCRDGQVESGRAMHSPVRDIHIARPAAVAVPNFVLRQPVLVRAGWQEARFFNLRVESSRLGSGGQNGTQAVVALSPVTTTRATKGVIAKQRARSIRHSNR